MTSQKSQFEVRLHRDTKLFHIEVLFLYRMHAFVPSLKNKIHDTNHLTPIL